MVDRTVQSDAIPFFKEKVTLGEEIEEQKKFDDKQREGSSSSLETVSSETKGRDSLPPNQNRADPTRKGADMLHPSNVSQESGSMREGTPVHDSIANGFMNQDRNIVVQGSNVVINVAPTFNMQLGPSVAYTQMTRANDSTSSPNNNAQPELKKLPEREILYPLLKSSRKIREDDIEIVSKRMGSGWKEVGNQLKFNWSQLDQIERDTGSLSAAAHRMLYKWMQHKDERATVGSLSKALFKADEYEAILVLQE